MMDADHATEGGKMSVVNEPKIKNPLIVAIREQPELPKTIANGDGVCEIRFAR